MFLYNFQKQSLLVKWFFFSFKIELLFTIQSSLNELILYVKNKFDKIIFRLFIENIHTSIFINCFDKRILIEMKNILRNARDENKEIEFELLSSIDYTFDFIVFVEHNRLINMKSREMSYDMNIVIKNLLTIFFK